MENVASMTEYEIISTTISIFALALSILIPLSPRPFHKFFY